MTLSYTDNTENIKANLSIHEPPPLLGERAAYQNHSHLSHTIASAQRTIGACCVGRTPNLVLLATLAPENLSSGEKRAGCADSVRLPSGFAFCHGDTAATQIDQAGQRGTRKSRMGVCRTGMFIGGISAQTYRSGYSRFTFSHCHTKANVTTQYASGEVGKSKAVGRLVLLCVDVSCKLARPYGCRYCCSLSVSFCHRTF